MDPNQKFLAFKALCMDAALRMDTSGRWYVDLPHVEMKRGGLLSSGAAPRSVVQSEAVDLAWEWWTSGKNGDYIVIDAYTDRRRAVRWAGFMWQAVEERRD